MKSASLQLTLAILKPHVVKSPFALQKIREVILKNDFKVVRTRRLTITPKLGSEFYADHKNKFFYTRLITFMSSGPSDVHILASQNAITKWRELLGPTKAIQAQYTAPDSIRGKYGLSDTRNAAHGADSEDSVRKEIAIFFKEFDIDQWYAKEEPYFATDKVTFVPELFVHVKQIDKKDQNL